MWVCPELFMPKWTVQGFHSHWGAVISKMLLAAGIPVQHLLSSLLASLYGGFHYSLVLNKILLTTITAAWWPCSSPPHSWLMSTQGQGVTLPCTHVFDLSVSCPLTKHFLYNMKLCQDQNVHSRSFLLLICFWMIHNTLELHCRLFAKSLRYACENFFLSSSFLAI